MQTKDGLSLIDRREMLRVKVKSLAEEARIKELVGANSIALRETVDPTVIGGVRVKTPESTLDATIINKLHALKRAKQ
jgi:F0F1-type ATP synthase delta subunit